MIGAPRNFVDLIANVICATVAIAASAAHADVTISSDTTQNMSCSAGVCSPTATNAVLNVTDLENLLASGSIEVTTTGSGVQADNIELLMMLTWSSSSVLSLDAYASVEIDNSISVEGLSGLTLVTNDGGSGGTLSFGESGNIAFANLSSSLIVNGTSYFLLGTVKDLATAIANNPSGAYAFANEYDASTDGTYKNTPVPTNFTGTFEGLGNIISHLTIDDSSDLNIGLFAEVDAGGNVSDIRLRNARVVTNNGKPIFAGILVGWNDGTIEGCSTSGTIKDIRAKGGGPGGLAGLNNSDGVIFDSNSSASVSSDDFGALGGFVAANLGAIESSFATGPVSGGNQAIVGGLLGENGNNGTVNVTYATGAVTGGNSSFAGGLVGETIQQNQISNSYATGSVSVGVGTHHRGLFSYSGGTIGASNYPGTVTAVYSTGPARGAGGQPTCGGRGEYTCVGGSMGWNGGAASDVYWDITSSDNENGTGHGSGTDITGLTSKQLKSGIPSGFDPAIWGQQAGINHGFPYLLAIPPKK